MYTYCAPRNSTLSALSSPLLCVSLICIMFALSSPCLIPSDAPTSAAALVPHCSCATIWKPKQPPNLEGPPAESFEHSWSFIAERAASFVVSSSQSLDNINSRYPPELQRRCTSCAPQPRYRLTKPHLLPYSDPIRAKAIARNSVQRSDSPLATAAGAILRNIAGACLSSRKDERL